MPLPWQASLFIVLHLGLAAELCSCRGWGSPHRV